VQIFLELVILHVNVYHANNSKGGAGGKADPAYFPDVAFETG
jgi:hypothetical protein